MVIVVLVPLPLIASRSDWATLPPVPVVVCPVVPDNDVDTGVVFTLEPVWPVLYPLEVLPLAGVVLYDDGTDADDCCELPRSG